MMHEVPVQVPEVRLDPLLDLADMRLASCPAAAQDDLRACLTLLRYTRDEGSRDSQAIDAVNRHHSKVITMGSKGLEHQEDRALSLMVMAITEMLENTVSSNAQADRTLRKIRARVRI